MDSPFIKTELVGPGPFDFWRKKLYELREGVYRRMEEKGECPVCLQSGPHKDCGFAQIEHEIIGHPKEPMDKPPSDFWKLKLEGLIEVLYEAGADDAICVMCGGSWSCKGPALCAKGRIVEEIRNYKPA